MHMWLTVKGVWEGFAIKETHNLQTNLLWLYEHKSEDRKQGK
jgi:hypothetical protein